MRAPYKLTPMHYWHQQHGAEMADVAGWQCPLSYGDPTAEIAAGNSAVAIADATPLSKVDIQGHGLNAFLGTLFGASLPVPGHCEPVVVGSKPAYLVRLASDRAIVLADSEQRVFLVSHLSEAAAGHTCVHVTDMTSAYAAIRLVGPMSSELLKKVSSAPVETMPADACVQTAAARVWCLLVRRDYPRALSWLALVARDYAEYVWEAFLSAGKNLQIKPFGAKAERAIDGTGASDVAAV